MIVFYLIFLALALGFVYQYQFSIKYANSLSKISFILSFILPLLLIFSTFEYTTYLYEDNLLIAMTIGIVLGIIKAILLIFGGLVRFVWFIMFFYSPPISVLISSYIINNIKKHKTLSKEEALIERKIVNRNKWALGIFCILILILLISPMGKYILETLYLIFIQPDKDLK